MAGPKTKVGLMATRSQEGLLSLWKSQAAAKVYMRNGNVEEERATRTFLCQRLGRPVHLHWRRLLSLRLTHLDVPAVPVALGYYASILVVRDGDTGGRDYDPLQFGPAVQ